MPFLLPIPALPAAIMDESSSSGSESAKIAPDGPIAAPSTLTESSTSFRESKIAIAVDTSGSTYDEALDAEKRAIQSICTLIPRDLRPGVTILPWNDEAGEQCSVDNLDSLDSHGGTEPSALLYRAQCRHILQKCDFWFLMTDGLIVDKSVREFAGLLLGHGLHGKACVVSVFGHLYTRPAACDISVGLSVFAISPHVAFLYTDVESQNTFILQTKGCFSQLLPRGRSNPDLSQRTKWGDLPKTSYENLSRVSVPRSQVAAENELVLDSGAKLNLDDLFLNLPHNDATIGQILDNEDNLKSVALTAKVRGQVQELQNWLDRVDYEMERPKAVERPDQNPQSELLTNIIEGLQNNEPSDHVSALQKGLQEVNSHETQLLLERVEAQSKKIMTRRRSSNTARKLSFSGTNHAGENLGHIDTIGPAANRTRSQQEKSSQALFNSGFSISHNKKESFRGTCALCGGNATLLALLLRHPPEQEITAGFPAPGTRSKLIFPLTVGNYPETDVVVSFIACDPCSYRLLRRGQAPDKSSLVAALPLVSYRKNSEAWLETIQIATGKRFHQSDLPLIFLAILYTKMERLLESDKGFEQIYLREAIKWTCNMILSDVVLSGMGKPELDRLGLGLIHEVLLRNFRAMLEDNPNSILLEYPLDGFIVSNVALSNSVHSEKLSGSKRKRIILLRFLYYLAEKYYEYLANNGECLVHAAKELILLTNDPVGPRSLLRWENLRQLSLRFNNPLEMRRFFAGSARDPPKKLSITINDLIGTPLFDFQAMNSFQRLGILFNWISSQAGHATAAFLHHLLRTKPVADTVGVHFTAVLKNSRTLRAALATPEDLSARGVEDIIKDLPPIYAV